MAIAGQTAHCKTAGGHLGMGQKPAVDKTARATGYLPLPSCDPSAGREVPAINWYKKLKMCTLSDVLFAEQIASSHVVLRL